MKERRQEARSNLQSKWPLTCCHTLYCSQHECILLLLLSQLVCVYLSFFYYVVEKERNVGVCILVHMQHTHIVLHILMVVLDMVIFWRIEKIEDGRKICFTCIYIISSSLKCVSYLSKSETKHAGTYIAGHPLRTEKYCSH